MADDPLPAAEMAARTFYNANRGAYPMPEQAAPAAASTPASAASSAPPGASPAPAPPAPADNPSEGFYAPVVTRGLVDWNEPPATAPDFDLQASPGVLDRSDAGMATLGRLRDGLAAAGAGQTVARELFNDAVRAVQDPPWTVPRAQAEAELRQHFGPRYDAQIGAASALIQKASARCPEIIPFLERTGLGNSPEFIRKLAAAAGRRRG